MLMKTVVLIGLGSNKSFGPFEPTALVVRAARALQVLGPIECTPFYGSEAWPDPAAPPYVNAVAAVETAAEPESVLEVLLAIEAGFGRRRAGFDRYAPRTLDLDLLAAGPLRRDTPRLCLPHPRLAERGFVLLPLRDLVPDFVHPVTGRTVDEMIDGLVSPGTWPLSPQPDLPRSKTRASRAGARA
ncbi:2-amino-4-hydroxy-6-hydroxymethyldihydropteridine diphosphokinase [Parvularcula dongshanensis]|uniref:2-amino-4-hydroxy-6-hydroxymethyldihydropteridine pyrophosphokinase n=1 Tax=Parvularcula dongshanensis TaxID=1173995 RepID=A0A840I4U7_9PROT|nr:2-amino-4-hydroxy-6-hydroxymethyldihydropteridine diphosphokinase [Parvularcula dongshanensis]MBB4659986.1 2-amino-4-hydroxy-6-hydroxymethyldihydropteridine diphosphokinase [Parvularcula dongshanensis]